MIDALAQIELTKDVAAAIDLSPGVLRLRRAWPRSSTHLLLQYDHPDGSTIAGQWCADVAAMDKIARQTRRAVPKHPCAILGERILLQPGGADRKLVALPGLLERPNSTLLTHRPERRAVVRLDGDEGTSYAKVYRPDAVPVAAAVTETLLQSGRLDRHAMAIASVRETRPDEGVVVYDELSGRTLLESIEDPRGFVDGAWHAGTALRLLHGVDDAAMAGLDLPTHDGSAEAALLRSRHERLSAHVPTTASLLEPALDDILQRLSGIDVRCVPAHRDFYDKQIVIDPNSSHRVGLLDFDTTAWADPALDVANFLVHLELRFDQNRCPRSTVERAADAFLAGYGRNTIDETHLDIHRDSTRLRLACLYAYRPRWPGLPEVLLGRIGAATAG